VIGIGHSLQSWVEEGIGGCVQECIIYYRGLAITFRFLEGWQECTMQWALDNARARWGRQRNVYRSH
jgi:hypothetical protein